MKVFLCNRGNFKSYEDEGTPLPGTETDYWVKVDNLEQARQVVNAYMKNNAIEGENWFGGHLVIGGSCEGCFDYMGGFHRRGSEFADHRLVWLQAFTAKQRILRLTQMN